MTNKIIRTIIHDLLDNCSKEDLDYIQGAIEVKIAHQKKITMEDN